MNLTELKEQKQVAENSIASIISQFEVDTGLRVDDINILVCGTAHVGDQCTRFFGCETEGGTMKDDDIEDHPHTPHDNYGCTIWLIAALLLGVVLLILIYRGS